MTTHLNPPDAKQLASSLDVVTNPAIYTTAPIVFATAWETLLAGRGQSMHIDRLGPPAHLVAFARNGEEEARRSRVRCLVRRVARAKGYSLREDRFHAGAAT